MSNIYYSGKRNGFYDVDLKEVYKSSANGWPDDAVAISTAQYEELLQGQSSGRLITADSSGLPILIDPEIDWQARAEQQRQGLLSAANATIADWRTELQLDVISENDRASLIKWMEYIRSLKSLDFSTLKNESDYTSFKWPVSPE
ncbi:tail fiber assembly protein [Pantoea agglomerans]|uniref:tail fiber assembly protein n=1 Tax=Enterobacter agglomerans TaxID=549 RepID=UPI003C7DB8BA